MIVYADPGEAKGLTRVALVAAMRELADRKWHDRGAVEKAMQAASTLKPDTCRNWLRKWAHWGLVTIDPGYSVHKGRHLRRPQVGLTVVGKAWATENLQVTAPVRGPETRKPRSQAPSVVGTGESAGQGPRLVVSLQDEAASRPPSPREGSVGRSPSDGDLSQNGHNDTAVAEKETCGECDREPGHLGSHMAWNAEAGCWEPLEPEPKFLTFCWDCALVMDADAPACRHCHGPTTTENREQAQAELVKALAEQAERSREDRRRRMAANPPASTFRPPVQRKEPTPVW